MALICIVDHQMKRKTCLQNKVLLKKLLGIDLKNKILR